MWTKKKVPQLLLCTQLVDNTDSGDLLFYFACDRRVSWHVESSVVQLGKSWASWEKLMLLLIALAVYASHSHSPSSLRPHRCADVH